MVAQFQTALTAVLALSGASHVLGKGVRSNGRKLQNVCVDPGLDISMSESLMAVMSTTGMWDAVMDGLEQFATDGVSIGSSTALLPEANDAAVTGATIEDGQSGDVNFPHGNIKPLATAGERSVCLESYGWKITGTPDGLGAYLPNDDTVRVVVQSEGYGPLRYESFKFPVNDGAATFGGSHIQYVDYDRESLSMFMNNADAASTMVTGAGEMIENVINLKGEPVGRRNGESPTSMGAHFANTDANGTYAMLKMVAEADWFLQSLCSAHLEQQHQWGPGIGLEDDIFLTSEEWSNYALDQLFVGLSVRKLCHTIVLESGQQRQAISFTRANSTSLFPIHVSSTYAPQGHALDIQTKTLYALGGITQGGFEKIIEVNPQNPDYIILAISGYNGPFDINDHVPDKLYPENMIEARNVEYGPRADGNNYTFTKDIVPFRIFVGVKGKLEDGSEAPADDFLARNGLKYGQMYGFAIDMRNDTGAVGPTAGEWRDAWHKTATNGETVPGKWIAQPWRWDGEVRNFQHDGSWDYQNPPPGTEAGSELEGYYWWVSNGIDKGGCKTEHITGDPRPDTSAFIQGSTCGYFGHLYINDVVEVLAVAGGELPTVFDGSYYVYQGETDITEQVVLNGAGRLPDGRNATRNWDNADPESTGKVTFEDVDGLEAFQAADGNMYLMIQEDSGNKYGERMFISSPLEHEDDGEDLTYYFVAMSGGKQNSRQVAGVGVPAGVACHDGEKFKADAHEFSGLFDMSGLLRKNDDGTWGMSASDTGVAKLANNALVDINDKYILVGLQAGNFACGVIGAFQADRGGQWLLYQPSIPHGAVPSVEVVRQDFPQEESEDEETDGDGDD
ncbi:WGS project CAID00000000 data, contig chromosome [Seminavis robusta]|uniref:WGS project CAID00000000 data, contig chromosome n=1 Tax=Seminavis robusta TaxID=568900 RepID=A0A9N8E8Z9_9STRA|nr:WGS project CAID00000000 data, contig chromosome [Seminavis robusta]|eukprot:Sro641_g179940.1 WGS project CAID00000000 data, contig chromosome (847) ;mRNA; f:1022-4001